MSNEQIIYLSICVTDQRTSLGSIANLSTYVCVGFGEAKIYKDGVVFYDGEASEEEEIKELSYFEEIAEKEPGDWKLVLKAPLWNETWHRQGKGKWVCVELGEGFA